LNFVFKCCHSWAIDPHELSGN